MKLTLDDIYSHTVLEVRDDDDIAMGEAKKQHILSAGRITLNEAYAHEASKRFPVKLLHCWTLGSKWDMNSDSLGEYNAFRRSHPFLVDAIDAMPVSERRYCIYNACPWMSPYGCYSHQELVTIVLGEVPSRLLDYLRPSTASSLMAEATLLKMDPDLKHVVDTQISELSRLPRPFTIQNVALRLIRERAQVASRELQAVSVMPSLSNASLVTLMQGQMPSPLAGPWTLTWLNHAEQEYQRRFPAIEDIPRQDMEGMAKSFYSFYLKRMVIEYMDFWDKKEQEKVRRPQVARKIILSRDTEDKNILAKIATIETLCPFVQVVSLPGSYYSAKLKECLYDSMWLDMRKSLLVFKMEEHEVELLVKYITDSYELWVLWQAGKSLGKKPVPVPPAFYQGNPHIDYVWQGANPFIPRKEVLSPMRGTDPGEMRKLRTNARTRMKIARREQESYEATAHVRRGLQKNGLYSVVRPMCSIIKGSAETLVLCMERQKIPEELLRMVLNKWQMLSLPISSQAQQDFSGQYGGIGAAGTVPAVPTLPNILDEQGLVYQQAKKVTFGIPVIPLRCVKGEFVPASYELIASTGIYFAVHTPDRGLQMRISHQPSMLYDNYSIKCSIEKVVGYDINPVVCRQYPHGVDPLEWTIFRITPSSLKAATGLLWLLVFNECGWVSCLPLYMKNFGANLRVTDLISWVEVDKRAVFYFDGVPLHMGTILANVQLPAIQLAEVVSD
jgi:hypothetical protein